MSKFSGLLYLALILIAINVLLVVSGTASWWLIILNIVVIGLAFKEWQWGN
ncbi:MAG: hypothetical protein AAB833_00265 [Patescibacteria group bacterium]